MSDAVTASLVSAGVVWFINAAVLLIHILCPAFSVDGYACHVLQRETPLHYRLNGMGCLLISVLLFALTALYFPEATLFLSYNYVTCAIMSNFLGLAVSYYLVYVRFPSLSTAEQKANSYRRAPTTSGGGKKPSSANDKGGALEDRTPDFYWGREFSPRYQVFGEHQRTVDVKMFLYIVGAVMLELNVLSALQRERVETGENSRCMMTYTFLMTWFVMEYLFFERIHLYTYDLFAEKVGFKLAWGCLCFYPYFYELGMFPIILSKTTTTTTTDMTPGQVAGTVVLFYSGNLLTRGANLQKCYFRRFPHQTTVFGGLLKQETLPSCDLILCSGFWSMARHINYLGEIVQAVALGVPGYLSHSSSSDDDSSFTVMRHIVPWLYAVYYVMLMIPRERDDEKIMRQKYGDKIMNEYIEKVPYRMVPGVY